MVKSEFSHGDVLRLFPEIKAISLIKWVERGLFKPLYEPPTSGGKRLYSYANLIQIGFIQELASFRTPTPWIKEYALKNPRLVSVFEQGIFSGTFFQYFRTPREEFHRTPRGDTWVILPGETFFPPEKALSCLLISLGELQKEIDARLVEEGWK